MKVPIQFEGERLRAHFNSNYSYQLLSNTIC